MKVINIGNDYVFAHRIKSVMAQKPETKNVKQYEDDNIAAEGYDDLEISQQSKTAVPKEEGRKKTKKREIASE